MLPRLSAFQIFCVVSKYKFLQLRNILAATLNAQRKGTQSDASRQGTARKGQMSVSRVISSLVLIWIFFGGMSLTTMSGLVINFKKNPQLIGFKLPTNTGQPLRVDPGISEAGKSIVRSRPFLYQVSFLALITFVGLIAVSMGFQGRNLARLDMVVEQLLTLPISIPLIFYSRLVEYIVFGFGWGVYFPFCTVLLFVLGYRWSVIPLALGLTLVFNCVLAIVQFVLEILLRRFFSASGISNFQILATLSGSLFVSVFGMFPIFGEFYPAMFQWCDRVGRVAWYLVPSLGFNVLQGGVSARDFGALGIQLAGVMVTGLIGWTIIGWASRAGLEAVSGREAGQRKQKLVVSHSRIPGFFRREFIILRREKRAWISMLSPLLMLLPILIIPNVASSILSDPLKSGAMAFGYGMLLLVTVSISIVIFEGEAFWILYTVPQSLLRLLLQRTVFWLILAWVTSLVIWMSSIAYRHRFEPSDVVGLVWIIGGLPILGVLGMAMGMLFTDPLARESNQQIRSDLAILPLAFGGLFTGGMFLPGIWLKLNCFFLFGMLALSWLQKASQHVEYLLDPTALPPHKVHAADGFSIGVLFLVVFIFLTAGFTFPAALKPQVVFSLSYCVAALVTVCAMAAYASSEQLPLKETFSVWQSGIEESRETVLVMLKGIGLVLVIVGGSYFLPVPRPPLPAGPSGVGERLVLTILGPVIALGIKPVWEEFLFRGFIYQGLKTSLSPMWAGILSASVFCLFQPPWNALPVFLLGLVTAWIFEQSKSLIASMVVHAVYNGGLIGIQWLVYMKYR